MSPGLYVLLGCLAWSIGSVAFGMLIGRALYRLERTGIADVTSFNDDVRGNLRHLPGLPGEPSVPWGDDE